MTTFKKIHDVACFFQLNTTWKGKLIYQIESNSRMRPTVVWIHLQRISNIFNINFDSYYSMYSSMVHQKTNRHVCFIFPLS